MCRKTSGLAVPEHGLTNLEESSPRLSHIPHPIHFRVVSWSDVEQIGPPSEPDTNSTISEVQVVSIAEANGLFGTCGADYGALYQLAGTLRENQTEA